MTKPTKPAIVIKEIKRVWEPGMSAKQVTAALNPKIVKLSRGTVTNYFRKFKDQLDPCYLPEAIRKKQYKPAVEPPVYGETYINSQGITLPKVFRD